MFFRPHINFFFLSTQLKIHYIFSCAWATHLLYVAVGGWDPLKLVLLVSGFFGTLCVARAMYADEDRRGLFLKVRYAWLGRLVYTAAVQQRHNPEVHFERCNFFENFNMVLGFNHTGLFWKTDGSGNAVEVRQYIYIYFIFRKLYLVIIENNCFKEHKEEISTNIYWNWG